MRWLLLTKFIGLPCGISELEHAQTWQVYDFQCMTMTIVL